MTITIELSPESIAFLKFRGQYPEIKYNRDMISKIVEGFLRSRDQISEKYTCKSPNVVTFVPPHFSYTQNRVHISKREMDTLDEIFKQMLKEDMMDDIMLLNQRLTAKRSIELINLKYGLTEDILSYDTVKKRLQRHEKSLKTANSQHIE